jgi:hypothetical protein
VDGTCLDWAPTRAPILTLPHGGRGWEYRGSQLGNYVSKAKELVAALTMGRMTSVQGDRVVRAPIFVADEQDPQSSSDVHEVRMADLLADIADKTYDDTRRVDEYQDGGSVTTLEVLPIFELPEVIESIIITAPAGAVTLQLGNRSWALTIPAAGILVISPIAIRLNRHDRRVLTSASAVAMSLELMGYADVSTK